MATVNITGKNFQEEVLSCDRPVLVDFWAGWCGPCRTLSPVIDEISEEHPEIKVGKINVDDETGLAAKFNVMSIPFVAVFKNGEMTASSVGVRPKDEILSLLD